MRKSEPPTPLQGKILIRPITRTDWPHIEKLFGANGACGGCWCMWWRVPRGGKLWNESKGDTNKRAFKRLLTTGRVYGCLALVDDVPVGWCCIGPRSDFPRLERTKALKTDWDQHTWAVTCFFIRKEWRNYGLSSALLDACVKLARKHGAKRVEGYPVRIQMKTGQTPAAFVFTGLPQTFERQAFVNIAISPDSRPVYVKTLRGSRAKSTPA